MIDAKTKAINQQWSNRKKLAWNKHHDNHGCASYLTLDDWSEGWDAALKHAEKNLPYCPDCSDSLRTVEIQRPDKKYGQIIDHWEYYCIGCDKIYLLTERLRGEK